MTDYDTFQKALENLKTAQRQLGGIEVGVSRQALEEVLAYIYENSFCRC